MNTSLRPGGRLPDGQLASRIRRGSRARRVAAVISLLAVVGTVSVGQMAGVGASASEYGSGGTVAGDSRSAHMTTPSGFGVTVDSAKNPYLDPSGASMPVSLVNADPAVWGYSGLQPGQRVFTVASGPAKYDTDFPVNDLAFHDLYTFEVRYDAPIVNPTINLSNEAIVNQAGPNGNELHFLDTSVAQFAIKTATTSSGATITPALSLQNASAGYTVGAGNAIVGPANKFLYAKCSTTNTDASSSTSSTSASLYAWLQSINPNYELGRAFCGEVVLDTHGEAVSSVSVTVRASSLRDMTAQGVKTSYRLEDLKAVVSPFVANEVSGSVTPATYGAATHAVTGLTLGSQIKTAYDGTSLATATAGSGANTSDAGYDSLSGSIAGVQSSFTHLSVGKQVSATVPVSGVAQAASLSGWIDFNRNGVFDGAEKASVSVPTGSTSATLTWTVPSGTKAGDSQLRVRLGYDSTQAGSPTGMAASGEVEDYALTIAAGTPDLGIVKTNNLTPGDNATINQVVDYTLKVTNKSASDWAFAPTVTDTLPSNLSVVDAGTGTVSGQQVTWALADMAPGATQSLTLKTRVTAEAASTTNTASITTPDGCTTSGALGTVCETTNTFPTRLASLDIVKSAPANVTTMGTYEYSLVVTNKDTISTHNVAVTDVLPAGATFIAATGTTPAPAVNGRTLTWNLGTLDPNESITLTFTVTLDNTVAHGSNVTNSASVTSEEGCADAPGSSCTDDATSAVSNPSGSLNIAKTAAIQDAGTRTVATGGDTIVFTVTATNNTSGPVSVTSINDAMLAGAGVALTCPTLPARLLPTEALTCTSAPYTVTAADAAAGSVMNTATGTAKFDNNDNVPSTNGSSTTPAAVPSLTVTKSAQAQTAIMSTFPYTITVQNTGSVPANNTVITDTLPEGVTFGAMTTGANPASNTDGVITWNLGTIAAGESVTLTFTATLDTSVHVGDEIRNVASATTAGSCTGTCTDDATTEATSPTGGLVFSKNAAIQGAGTRTEAVEGDTIVYTITGTNTSPVAITVNSITDALLDNANVALNCTTPATVAPNGGTVTCIADPYTVTAADVADGSVLNVVTGTAQFPTTDTAPVTPGQVTTPTAENSLAVNKTQAILGGIAKPGATVEYTITVTNDSPKTNAFDFSDDLTDVLDDATLDEASVTASTGTATFASPSISWTGTLAPNGTATLTYSAQINDPDLGNHRMRNTVVASDDVPSNCRAGSTDTACSTDTGNIGQVTVTKSAVPTSGTVVAVGDTVTYTLRVLNDSGEAVTGTSMTDDLAGVLDDATLVSGSLTTTAGFADITDGVLTWTGDLDAGASATVTFAVTVKDTASSTGDHSLVNHVVSDASVTNCPDPAAPGVEDSRCVTSNPIEGLTIVKTSSVEAGQSVGPNDTVIYTIAVKNTGNTTLVGAQLTDDLSGVLSSATLDDATFASALQTSGLGSLNYSAPTLTWTGDLAPGQEQRIVYSVTVTGASTASGNGLTNSVTSTTPGTNCKAGSSDPQCTVVTPIDGFTIVKSTDKATANFGDVITYTITGTNTGTADRTGLSFTDVLDQVTDDATLNMASIEASTGTARYDQAANTILWNGDLAKGATVTLSYTVTVNDPSLSGGDHSLVNSVVSPVNGSTCAADSTDADCTTTTGIKSVTIEKTTSVQSGDVVKPGDKITYSIDIANTGSLPYSGVSFHDDLANVLANTTLDDPTFVGAIGGGIGTLDYTGTVLSWQGDLAVGESEHIEYTVTVKDSATVTGAALRNVIVADIPGTNCEADSTDARCATSTDVNAFEITKKANVTSAVAGDVVAYTITGHNAGTTDRTGLSIVDDLTNVLDDAALLGAPLASTGSATVDPITHVMTWEGDLAKGETVTITYSLKIKDTSTSGGDRTLTNVAVSDDGGSTCVTGSTDPACGGEILVSGYTITKSASVPTGTVVAPGDSVTYTIHAVNTGAVDLTGLSYTDDLASVLDDAELVEGSIGATAGTATFDGVNKTIVWAGDLAVGASADLSYTVTVGLGTDGDHSLVNVVLSNDGGSNCVVGSTDPRCMTVDAIDGLTILKTSDVPVGTAVVPGQVINFTVTATNTGSTQLTGAEFSDDMSGVLDDATWDGQVSATIGTATADAAAGTIAWTGDLAPGESARVTYAVTVKASGLGDARVSNRVVSNTPGTNCSADSSDPSCSTDSGVQKLSIVKTADRAGDAIAGDVIRYTVTICAEGSVGYDLAHVTDDMSDVLDDANYRGDLLASSGSAVLNGTSIEWAGPIAAGDTVTLSYSVEVKPSGSGDGVIRNIVASGDPGNTCPTGSTDASCSVTNKVTEGFSLPFTGVGGLVLLPVGVLALLGGGFLLWNSRRRKAQSEGSELI